MSQTPTTKNASKKKFSWVKLISIITMVLPAVIDLLDNGEDAVISLHQTDFNSGYIRADIYAGEKGFAEGNRLHRSASRKAV